MTVTPCMKTGSREEYPMDKMRIVIVGSGFRALTYVKIIRKFPERFELSAMLCRNQEKADRLAKEYGIYTSLSEQECEEMKPDFVIAAVNKESIFQVTKHWAEKQIPVLCETPAALTQSDLEELWKLKVCEGRKIQTAEQYFLQPLHQARRKLLKRGYIGEPYNINLSMAHDYHAASLIRWYLNLGMEPVTLWGNSFHFPVEETDSRYGAITDGRIADTERVRMTFLYKNGKAAFYDFSGIQYRTFIRTRHISVQGIKGEVDDNDWYYTDEAHIPQKKRMQPEYSGKGELLRIVWGSEVIYENPYPGKELTEDELAIESLLEGMGEYIRTGKEVYPLADALQDAYTLILMKEALKNPGTKVVSEHQPWMGNTE